MPRVQLLTLFVFLAVNGIVGAAVRVHAGALRAINVDGQYDDWDNVPVLATDPADNPQGIDLATVQVANDEFFLYLKLTFHTPVNPNGLPPSTFITIDTDNEITTGFNVLGLDMLGADVGWQNDFPFEMGDDVFNTGLGLQNGAGTLRPFFPTDHDFTTLEQELALPRFATFNSTGLEIFPNNSITLLVWTDEVPNPDHVDPIAYTFAREVPLGDADGNGLVDAFDVDDFEQALADRAAYETSFTDLDADQWGDFDVSGTLDAFDVDDFESALAGSLATRNVPEPGTITVLLLSATAALSRRRVACQ